MDRRPILVTGAAGKLARYLRPRLIERYGRLRLSDHRDPGPIAAEEETANGELADFDAVHRAVAGCRAILHFGACIIEERWDVIHSSNVVGTYNVFEAARRCGVKRIVYASSVHAVGYHPVTERLDARSEHRADSFYGVSKVFAESLACMYAHKADMDIACLRIGSALPEPTEPRHLSTWLSYPDLFRLVSACLDAPTLGYTIMYGASANTRSWWDNSRAPHVAYVPQDDAELYAPRILAQAGPRNPSSPVERFQGGFFCAPDFVKW